jgi:hypothetical protein
MRPVTRLIGLLVISALSLQLGTYPASAKDQRPILMRVWDSDMNFRPAAGPNNVENCMIVYQDGHLHLEIRRQEILSGIRGIYLSYEGKLPDRNLTSLRSMLDGADVKNLPTPNWPKQLPGSDHFGSFKAEISRGSGVQEIGYFVSDVEPKLSEDASTQARNSNCPGVEREAA